MEIHKQIGKKIARNFNITFAYKVQTAEVMNFGKGDRK